MNDTLGDFEAGQTVHFKWNTVDQDGASISRDGSPPSGTIRIYKDDDLAQRASSAGITDSPDFDGITGVHHCSIDTDDDTDAGFYEPGHDYQVVIFECLVDGSEINAVIAHFSLENRFNG